MKKRNKSNDVIAELINLKNKRKVAYNKFNWAVKHEDIDKAIGELNEIELKIKKLEGGVSIEQ